MEAAATSGATYRNDFIELFNRGTNPVNVTGWSVQYASASGTWQGNAIVRHDCARELLSDPAAGRRRRRGTSRWRCNGPIPISVSGGKIALLSNSSRSQSVAPSARPTLRILWATARRTAPKPVPPRATATQHRFAAISTGAWKPKTIERIFPRRPCSQKRRFAHAPLRHPAGRPLNSRIQGTNILSPLVDQFITTTTNIVTALRNNGFFFQTSDEADDGNPLTSEGLFVLTGGAPNVSVGNGVVVSGTVIEFKPASDPASPT